MNVGQKVVCVDDYFAPEIAAMMTALPKEGVTYVIREVFEGESIDDGKPAKKVVTLLLVGLHNPYNTPPTHEHGFNAKRFRPLEELKDKAAARRLDIVYHDAVGVNDGDVRIYEPAKHQ